MDIFNAVLVLAGIGLLGAVLLVVAAKLMYVPSSELTDSIRELLPGANCGACGYAGCDDYAAAVASGEAEAHFCVPGGSKVAVGIAALLGQKAHAVSKLVAIIACKGCSDKQPKYDYQGVKTCTAAIMLHAGPNKCSYGCEGLGDCAAGCPFDAICIEDGVAHINQILCRGCGACVATCPKKLISLQAAHMPTSTIPMVRCSNHDKGAITRKLCANGCIGCMKCEKVCEHDAIHVVNNCAAIDTGNCVQCGRCMRECPTGVIRIL